MKGLGQFTDEARKPLSEGFMLSESDRAMLRQARKDGGQFRERRATVLHLLSQGMRQADICRKLHMCHNTVLRIRRDYAEYGAEETVKRARRNQND